LGACFNDGRRLEFDSFEAGDVVDANPLKETDFPINWSLPQFESGQLLLLLLLLVVVGVVAAASSVAAAVSSFVESAKVTAPSPPFVSSSVAPAMVIMMVDG